MRRFFCKAFTPWRSEAYFEDDDTFCGYLVRYNRVCNTIRVILFAAAAILLFIGYNASDSESWSIAAISDHPYYIIAVGVLVLALGVSLIMIENEKKLPEELRAK